MALVALCMKKITSGFTLVELILVMIILGIGLSGVLSIMMSGVKNTITPELRWQLIVVGENITKLAIDQEIAPREGTLSELFPVLAKNIPYANHVQIKISKKVFSGALNTEMVNVVIAHKEIGETHFSAIKNKGKS